MTCLLKCARYKHSYSLTYSLTFWLRVRPPNLDLLLLEGQESRLTQCVVGPYKSTCQTELWRR